MLYTLTDLHKHYTMGRQEVKALNGVDLEIEGGKFYSFIGPSGSGKSTLLHLLGLLDTPTQGKVWFDGIDTASLSEDEKATIRNERVGFIFQKYYLIPVLNVYENIEMPFLQNTLFSRLEVDRRIKRLIGEIGLEQYWRHKPAELSGGQQQRVAIARALAMKPKVVLADEPTANLDSRTGEDIVRLMRDLNREEGVTFIFSTHDPMVMDYSDRVYSIRDGVLASQEVSG
jgi:putative ABC transport system ATP-binding protein